jgi:ComF family protein
MLSPLAAPIIKQSNALIHKAAVQLKQTPQQLRKLLQLGGQVLLPSPCLLCGDLHPQTLSALICNTCLSLLPRQTGPLCLCCALPLSAAAQFCGHCLKQQPAFSRSCIPFIYSHPLDSLIHSFKYQRHLSSGKLLGELFIAQLQQLQPEDRPDFLVPTPTHWLRRWQRGFNPTEVLGQQLANALGLPLVLAAERHHQDRSQKDLSRRERQRNLRQAFSLQPKLVPMLQAAHIALVDDVVTTTATARCLSELLCKGGAQRVDIWALARTPEH